MNVPREAISAALFNLLNTNAALSGLVATITRVPALWTKVSPADMPALILFKSGPGSEGPTQNARGLTRWAIDYNLWLYLRADAASATIPETTANNIVDAIDAALQGPYKGAPQTLGGLVTNAWLDGPQDWDGGIIDQQMVVALKVRVLTGV